MSGDAGRSLWPLWSLAAGVVAGAAMATQAGVAGAPALRWALAAVGVAALARGVTRRPRAAASLLLLAGLALGGARGLACQADRLALAARLAAVPAAALRIEATLTRGWTASRWGWRSEARVATARQGDQPVRLPRRVTLEVRGPVRPSTLPAAGSTVAALVTMRARAARPLLVASSARLLTVERAPHGLEGVRAAAARSLLDAAATAPRSIRAAELAAALVLGRRDLVPVARREQWRRSGLAHALAVSGLHVGLIGGTVWLLAVALGATPTTARVAVLVTLPMYALIAGASPSALRAALMGVVYLGARLLGRAPLPLAAVLAAATGLLLAEPRLVLDAGFQLTVVITAALVRWAPSLAAHLPLPRRAALVLAVPVVAQLAAAPLVAVHFRTLVPGAVFTNTVAPLVLAPLLLAAAGAALLAPLWAAGARAALAVVGGGERLLMAAGTLARGHQLTAPKLAPALIAGLALAGALALWPGRRARWGTVAWVALLALGVSLPGAGAPPVATTTLLPVSDGASLLVRSTHRAVLVDGGRYDRQAVQLLADAGVRRLAAVVASHTDQDHIGGLSEVLDELPVGQLLLPSWMEHDAGSVPLLRAARRRGVAVRGVSRGVVVGLGGGVRLATLWPPARGAPADENDRSLVVRVGTPVGTVLVTSDVSAAVERRLAASTRLACDVLLLPHHGSRRSSSAALLDAARPHVVLIPAGPGNLQHHPHAEVLDRLRRRLLPWRDPAHSGWCGARHEPRGWRLYP